MKTILCFPFVLVALVTTGVTFADAGHGDKAAAVRPAGGGHWMAPEDAANRKNPVAASAESIARGHKLFQANCASCHGAGGKGDGPAGTALDPRPADLTAMAGAHPDGDFAWKIEHGRGAMPAWRGVLSEAQIWDAVNFIQSLAPKKNDADMQGHSPVHGRHHY